MVFQMGGKAREEYTYEQHVFLLDYFATDPKGLNCGLVASCMSTSPRDLECCNSLWISGDIEECGCARTNFFISSFCCGVITSLYLMCNKKRKEKSQQGGGIRGRKKKKKGGTGGKFSLLTVERRQEGLGAREQATVCPHG